MNKNNQSVNKNILVSICIPTYSRLYYLQKAIESANNQTYKNIEINVSQNPKEDGPDKSIQVWCKEQEANGFLNYYLNETNLGLTGNLNALARVAKGDYIIFLGDDDLLEPNFIEESVRAAQSTNAEIIFSNQVFINADGGVLENETTKLNSIYKRDKLNTGLITDAVELVFNNSIPLSAAIIKKNVFNKFSFNEKLNTPEFPFFLKIALNNGAIFYINRKLAYYRLHNNSETYKGLATDELVKELISIQVPSKYQDLKKSCIQNTIVPAINKALFKGNYNLAKELLNSEYYPDRKNIKLVQSILRHMPKRLVQTLLNLRKIT